MTTLIAQYNSEGCTGRCDAKCYNATGGECDCICCGANHGVGQKKAMENTAQMVEGWIDRWNAEHPDTTKIMVRKPGAGLVRNEQIGLFAEVK